MKQPLTRLESASVKLFKLLDWGMEPVDAAPHQRGEWPYLLFSDGEKETKKLCAVMNEINKAMSERGLT